MAEVDDAYFGGNSDKEAPSDRRRTGRGTTKTKVVVGLATERDKPVYVKMQVVPVLNSEELSGFVLDNADPEAVVVTGIFKGYLGLHEIVYRHEAKVYASASEF